MTEWQEIVVPQLGVNDDRVRVVEWQVEPGAQVHRGTVLAELETSKATFNLESEGEGYFYPLVDAGAEASIRSAVGLLSPTPDAGAVARYRAATPRVADTASGPQLTAKARALAEQLGVDLALLPTGLILREADILRIAGPTVVPLLQPESGDAVVYGASQGGMVVAEAMRSLGRFNPVAYIDDNPALAGVDFGGLPVWPGSELASLPSRGIVGVGTHMAKAAVRLDLLRRTAEAGVVFLNVIHARAWVAPSVTMGAGNLIKAGAIVDDYAVLGDACIIDNGVIMPHHNQLGSGVHLAPGVCMGGDCTIGDESIIGVGVTLAPRVQIGRRVIVGAGAVVSRDVPDGTVVEASQGRAAGSRAE